MSLSKLTGGLTIDHRRGTLVDWNLCFSADGRSSGRNFRSGTPAFMAPTLLSDERVTRRTLAHDMESFFAVIIWIASLDYDSISRFQNKPLVSILVDGKKARTDIAHAKESWFKIAENFKNSIIDNLEEPYLLDVDFVECLTELRKILYSSNFDENAYLASLRNKVEAKQKENPNPIDPDPMKEDVFRKCMKAIDEYLGDTKGCKEIEDINSLALVSHSQTSESVEEGMDGSG